MLYRGIWAQFAMLAATVQVLGQNDSAGVRARAQPIEIIRDTYGVPHIFAGSLADAAYGQGYCHAEDNLALVLEMTANARGIGASIVGRGRLEFDFLLRAFRVPEIARQSYDGLTPDRRAIVDGYAAGINRYLSEHVDQRPAWLKSMTGVDVVAITKLRHFQESLSSAQADLIGEPQVGRERDQANPAGDGGASNMWALAPSRTTDGSVVLLSDPHLPWDGPTKWHEAHLVVGDRWIYGATFASAVGIGIGFTADVAWGMTNNGADIGDVYRITLDPNNHNLYRFDEGWRETTTQTFSVDVREADGSTRSVEKKIRFTHHGPIVQENATAHQAFAARLAGLESPAFTLSWVGNFNAQNLTELEAGFDAAFINKWNCVAADRHGNIGYYYFCAARERSDDFRWDAPVDGSISATQWGKQLTWRDLPHTRNPPSRYLMNCNNNSYTVTRDCPLLPSNYPRNLMSQGTTLPPTTRAHRAMELIEAKPQHDLASLQALALDIKTLAAQPLIELIVDAEKKAGAASADPSGQRKRAISILQSWDGIATTENLALPILSAYLEVTQPAAVPAGGKARRAGSRNTGGKVAPATPQEVLANFDSGLELLQKRWGDKPVTWGQVHVIRRGDKEFPMPGAGPDRGVDPFTCLFMAGAKRFTEGRYLCENGSSWMQLVAFQGGEVQAQTILPFGTSNNAASPHYADQMPLYAQRKLKKALLTRPEIEAAATARKLLSRE
jgi:acyl-homoserine-lactone acylase